MEIIPAVDIIDSQLVRLSQGNFSKQTSYSYDPIKYVKNLEAEGATRVHFVDLEGARKGRPQELSLLKAMKKETDLKIDFSGGVRTSEDIERVLEAGADWIALGSLAVKEPELCKSLLKKFEVSTFILGADVRNHFLAIQGWEVQTEIHIDSFIREYRDVGVSSFFCTAIERDGMMQGPDHALYASLIKKFPDIFLIASGGVHMPSEILPLKITGCKAAIIGKALLSGAYSFSDFLPISERKC